MMMRYVRLSLTWLLLMPAAVTFAEETEADAGTIRLITQEELKLANGQDSENLWLSLAGKIYDVKAGESYYGKGEAYHIFTGKDALVPYSSGVFNEEEAAKSWKELDPKSKLTEIAHWMKFYDKDERYPLVGHLIGNFYDAEGQATEENLDLHKQIEEQQALKKQQQEEKKREAIKTAEARKAARAKEKEQEQSNKEL